MRYRNRKRYAVVTLASALVLALGARLPASGHCALDGLDCRPRAELDCCRIETPCGHRRRSLGHRAYLRSQAPGMHSSCRVTTPLATGSGRSICGANAASACCRSPSAPPTSSRIAPRAVPLSRRHGTGVGGLCARIRKEWVAGLRRRRECLCRRGAQREPSRCRRSSS